MVTAVVVGVVERRSLRPGTGDRAERQPTVVGLGLVAVVVVTVLVLALRSPAVPVAAVGIVVVGIRLVTRREQGHRVADVLGLPVLVGLFGVAVALGTLGRSWSGPATVLSHLDAWGTAAAAAVASVLVNNLPAASLLASRVPPRPYALLVGLDVGPNLFVTGSLAWILWLRAARTVGARPVGVPGQSPRSRLRAPVHGGRRGDALPHGIALTCGATPTASSRARVNPLISS